MKIITTDKSFADYGKEYEVEVIERYCEGWKARLVSTGEIAFLTKGTFKVVEE